jgi:hypothetical protein
MYFIDLKEIVELFSIQISCNAGNFCEAIQAMYGKVLLVLLSDNPLQELFNCLLAHVRNLQVARRIQHHFGGFEVILCPLNPVRHNLVHVHCFPPFFLIPYH